MTVMITKVIKLIQAQAIMVKIHRQIVTNSKIKIKITTKLGVTNNLAMIPQMTITQMINFTIMVLHAQLATN